MKHDFEGSGLVSTEHEAYTRFRREMMASHYLTLNDDRRRRAAHLQDTMDVLRAMGEGAPTAGWSKDVDVQALGRYNRLGGNKF